MVLTSKFTLVSWLHPWYLYYILSTSSVYQLIISVSLVYISFFVFCLPISYFIRIISVCVVYISILWTRARCGIIKSGPAPLRWHFLSASLTSEALLCIVTAPCIITMDPNPTLAPRFKFISFDLCNSAPLRWHFLSVLTSKALLHQVFRGASLHFFWYLSSCIVLCLNSLLRSGVIGDLSQTFKSGAKRLL